jgi:photosystem II stability/assembly factor-like uncharacterized protein
MKKLLLISFAALVCTNCNAQTQGGWVWQNPLPTGNHLLDIHVIDNNNIVGVGVQGTIAKSTDGGTSWSVTNDGTTMLFGVHFTDVNNGCAVGGNYGTGDGLIKRTTDGGATWTSTTYDGYWDFDGVCFSDANTGFVVGSSDLSKGVILKSTNGSNFTLNYTVSTSSSGLTAIYFVNSTTGWAVGYPGKIYKTTNGGTSWTAQTSGTTESLRSVFFIDDMTGWVCGTNGLIKKTTDGGATWFSQTSGTTSELKSICFSNANTGSVVGWNGTVKNTIDGGTTWTTNTITTNDVWSVAYTNSSTALAVGKFGTVLKTTDGGDNWTPFSNPAITKRMRNSSFINENIGWAVGDSGMVMKTINGGATWVAQPTGSTTTNYYSAFFVNQNLGWVVGTGGSILKTTNGGTNWTPQGIISYDLASVFFLSADTGFTVGASGKIYKTTDGGTNWLLQTSNVSVYLSSIFFINSTTGWAVGNSGTIIKTTNGGTTWGGQGSGSTNALTDVYFTDENHGWAVGYSRTLLRTTNGGNAWVTGNSGIGTSQDLLSVYFTDTLNGIAISCDLNSYYNSSLPHYYSKGSYIYKTTNGGTSWSTQSNKVFSPLYSINFASDYIGWISGEGGTILKTIDAGTALTASSSSRNTCNGLTTGIAWVSPNGGVPPYTILWNTGATNDSITNLAAGNYSCTITDVNGETYTKSFTITELAPLTPPVISGNTGMCPNTNVTLTSSSSSAYLWNTGATIQSITVSTAGTYSVTITDANTCTASSSITITNNPVPNITVQCISWLTSSAAGNSYQWYQTGAAISGATSQSYNATLDAYYKVKVTANGCSTFSDSIYIDVVDWEWTRNVGTYAVVNSLITDASGNVYITGRYGNNPVTFGNITLTNDNYWNVFLVKYDAMGNVIWAKNSEGGPNSAGNGICADANGNVYITGSGSGTFGTVTVNADFFIVKYDSNGNAIWGADASATLGAGAAAIDVDASGNLYVTGSFYSNIDFGNGVTLPHISFSGHPDYFIAKYNSSGSVIWARGATTINATKTNWGSSVSTDASGNIYVAGNYESQSITLGGYTLTNSSTQDSTDIFLVKYDGSGNVIWAETMGGLRDDNNPTIAVDPSGNIIITGGRSDNKTFTFDTFTLSPGSYAVYIAKYGSNGNVVWAKYASFSGSQGNTNTVATDDEGNIYMTGNLGNATFSPITPLSENYVVKFNSTGDVLWGISRGGGATGADITVDSFDNIYVVGQTSNNLFVGKIGFDIVTALPTIVTEDLFALYPNPTNEIINFNFTEPIQAQTFITISNTLGQTVKTERIPAGQSNYTMNLSGLAAGIYVVKTESSEGVSSAKIIKQ